MDKKIFLDIRFLESDKRVFLTYIGGVIGGKNLKKTRGIKERVQLYINCKKNNLNELKIVSTRSNLLPFDFLTVFCTALFSFLNYNLQRRKTQSNFLFQVTKHANASYPEWQISTNITPTYPIY